MRHLPAFRRSSVLALALLLPSLLGLAASAEAQTRLLRFPDLHGEQVVFTYAGDLWLADATEAASAAHRGEGATARRLTTHPGVELFARFSPDGRWIAFTGQYEGDEQVYVIPTAGGEPRQLTFYPAAGPLPPRWGYDHQVMGWTPDGEAVVFRSFRDTWDVGEARLYAVSVGDDATGGALAGALPRVYPMPTSGAGDLSPDGTKVVYSPLARDFRHWKRYEGGWAQNLYVYDLEADASRRLTDHPRSERDPMWIGDRIVFASDRTGKLELYSVPEDIPEEGGGLRQLTDHGEWDVRWPSDDPATGRIVYELGGQLRILDLETGTTEGLSIRVPTDALARRPIRKPVANLIRHFALSPEAKRVLFVARGEIFGVPAEHGPTRNLTRTPGVFEDDAVWSPDGSTVAYVSDASGEEEIWIRREAGRGEAQQLTTGNVGRYSDLRWSPDGERLAFRDADARVHVLEVATGELVQVADDVQKSGVGWDWSPDGEHLALALTDPNGFRSLHLWSREDGTLRRITGEMWDESSPAWGPEGQYLYFIADRMFQPMIGSYEWNYLVDRETGIYAVALRDDVPHPFPPRSDEVEARGDDEPAAEEKAEKNGTTDQEKEGDDEDEAVEPVRIDYEGLAERVIRVPVEADNYFGVGVAEGRLVLLRGGASYYGRAPAVSPTLLTFDLETRELKEVFTGVGGLALTPDGEKALVRQGNRFQLVDLATGETGAEVAVDGLIAEVRPEEEWAQIFDDAWRHFRDHFYVENMHGYDWPALREQYEPLLKHVGHRSDLNYLISEMIAELNVSHAYVVGGDVPIPERPAGALLGARFELDEASGRYRIAEIFPGQNEEDAYRSPLTEVGLDVEEGDYVLEIDGQPLERGTNPWRLLRHADPSYLELQVADEPGGEPRRVVVQPIGSEDDLIYLGWVEEKRRRVEEATGGKVGYVHIPDMSADGFREWIKWFYGQRYRQGLILDVRNNGGGNISPMIIERLQREIRMIDWERHRDLPDPIPSAAPLGHFVALLDEDTASDGDQFAWQFRDAGLGPLIGKRSWGGVVGIYGSYDLIDGGGVSVPEAGSGGRDGEWIIEGRGVEPDIEVDNDPADVAKGIDAQLEKAIEVILKTIEKDPPTLPERPAPPVKTE